MNAEAMLVKKTTRKKEQEESLYRVSLLNEMCCCCLEEFGNLGQRLVRLVPLAGLDEVAHGREEIAVVAGPQPRAKHDMLELRAVGYLLVVSK